MKLTDVLERLEGVRPCAGGWVARCPAHNDRRPSLSVREGGNGRTLLFCFAGCSFDAIIGALDESMGRQAVKLSATSSRARHSDAERTEFARRIWRETRPATGTLVEIYLRSRGIKIPPPVSLRLHPALRHPTGVLAPAMVAGVQNYAGNFIAIHRTYLAGDGCGKASLEPQKAALGKLSGGTVRLAAIAGEKIAIAEGIETALAIQQATGIPASATLGTSNLAQVKLPDCARTVIIAADGDEAGARSAQQAARRLRGDGRRVLIARPDRAGTDFNDYLTK